MLNSARLLAQSLLDRDKLVWTIAMEEAEKEQFEVRVRLADDEFVDGIFTLREIDGDDVQLDLEFQGRVERVVDQDYFHALLKLRKELEPEGIRVCCNGSAENVWPSGMSISMGLGVLGYRLTIGERGEMKNLVPIFESTMDAPPATVEDQTAFHERWCKSFGSGKQESR